MKHAFCLTFSWGHNWGAGIDYRESWCFAISAFLPTEDADDLTQVFLCAMITKMDGILRGNCTVSFIESFCHLGQRHTSSK